VGLHVRRIKLVGIFVGLCAAVSGVIISVVAGLPWWSWPVAGMAAYLVVYAAANLFMTRYVINRIKPVYQLLYSKDILTSRLSKWLRERANDDLVDDIQESLDHLVALSDNEIERLIQRERERTEFLESVAHAIRTPVSNIIGYARTLVEGTGSHESDRQYVERIARTAERLVHLVDDIEKLSCYESGGVVMHMSNFDIVELIYEVFDAHILNTQEKKIKLKLDKKDFSPKETVLVYADRLRIGQALESLIGNGIQYGKDGGTVTVALFEGYENIAVEVIDNGIGIPAHHLPHLFQKMYRVDQYRSPEHGGVGLSLAGVKRIMEAHGEHVTVRSEVGKGSTFTITIRKSGLVKYGVN